MTQSREDLENFAKLFTVQRCLVLESIQTGQLERENYLNCFKGEFLFRLDSTVRGKKSKFNVEFDEWNLFTFIQQAD